DVHRVSRRSRQPRSRAARGSTLDQAAPRRKYDASLLRCRGRGGAEAVRSARRCAPGASPGPCHIPPTPSVQLPTGKGGTHPCRHPSRRADGRAGRGRSPLDPAALPRRSARAWCPGRARPHAGRSCHPLWQSSQHRYRCGIRPRPFGRGDRGRSGLAARARRAAARPAGRMTMAGKARFRPLTMFSRPRIVRHEIADPRWTLPDLTIAVLADLHACTPWTPLSALARIVAATNELRPDLVLIPGDFIADRNLPARAIPAAAVVETLAPLSAPLGVAAVMGNHDWWDCRLSRATGFARNSVVEALERGPIRLLTNRAERLP